MTAELNPPPAAPVPAAGEMPAHEAVRCPLCEYDLRGLTEPRCPECGYRFDWADLTDPTRRRHPYLFEHYPERNVRSFVRTLLGGLRPARFWRSIHPAQRSRPGRLVAYWLAAASLPIAATVAHHALFFAQVAAVVRMRRVTFVQSNPPGSPYYDGYVREFGSIQAMLDEFHPLPPSRRFYWNAWQEERGWTLHLAAFWLEWPPIVFVTLLLFRVSMRRARIRPAHVLRCVLYSFDAVWWLGLVVLLAVAVKAAAWQHLVPGRWLMPGALVPVAPIPDDHIFRYRPDVVTDTLFWAGAAVLAWTGYRLTSALRHYLKFDHPAATVACAYAIAGLAVSVAHVRGWLW
jgi:hypothetical protein